MSVSAVATARRLTAAALTAGSLVGAMALPASAADPLPLQRSVQISDVQYNSPGWEDRSNRSLNGEWVEITNTGRLAVNLSGWTLSDEDGDTYTFRHFRLDGGSTVRVHTGIGSDSETDLYQDRLDYVWDNRSDTAILRNRHDRLVDAVSWGSRL